MYVETCILILMLTFSKRQGSVIQTIVCIALMVIVYLEMMLHHQLIMSDHLEV